MQRSMKHLVVVVVSVCYCCLSWLLEIKPNLEFTTCYVYYGEHVKAAFVVTSCTGRVDMG